MENKTYNIVFLPGHGVVKKSNVSETLIDILDSSITNIQKDSTRLAIESFSKAAFCFDYLDQIFYRLDTNGVGIKETASKIASLIKTKIKYEGTTEQLWQEMSNKHAESLRPWQQQERLSN